MKRIRGLALRSCCPVGIDRCRGEVDITAQLQKFGLHAKHTVKIPLVCLAAQGIDFANVQIDTGAPSDEDAQYCAAVGVDLKTVRKQ